jgi:hypothetical protein
LYYLPFEIEELFGIGNCGEHDLPLFFGDNEAISLIMLIWDIPERGFSNWFTAVLFYLFRQFFELSVMLLKIFPRNALKIWWLEHSFVS